MKTKRIVVVFVSLVFGIVFFAAGQTGPGGVGNSTTNKVWLDASYLTGLANGSRVSSWIDRSGNGWNAFQSNSAKRPTYLQNELNGQPIIRFDRTSQPQYLEITSSGIGTVMSNSNTLFAVARTISGAVNNQTDKVQTIFGVKDWFTGIVFEGFPIASQLYFMNWVGGNPPPQVLTVAAPISQGQWYVTTALPKNTSSGAFLTAFSNGTLAGTVSSGLQLKSYSNLVRIGAANTTGNYTYALNGDIAEIILFNFNLNEAQRIIVDNYLAAKYNFTIANDYYLNHDVNYIKDVQGIGTTDGASSKHSAAANGKGLLLSEINNTLDGPNEFLFAGQNTNTNSIVTTDIPLGEQDRWQRSWYLEKTGIVDVKLSFDFSQAGLAPEGSISSNLSSYKLLYRSSSSETFTIVKTGNDVLVPTVENGDQLVFPLSNAQLLNGYYTIGYSPSLVWTGAIDEQWENAANWNLNRVPTENDHVYINSCTTCPQLSQSVTISGLRLGNGSTLDIKNNMLTVLGASHANGARLVSNVGVVKAVDFGELKNSMVIGTITLEKTGGSDNNCYGGNTFSPELKLLNSSTYSWQVATQANNVIQNSRIYENGFTAVDFNHQLFSCNK